MTDYRDGIDMGWQDQSRHYTPAQLRALADRLESEECTGIAAGWCPVHGSCTCPEDREGHRMIDTLLDTGCALHGAASNHAEAIARECGARR